MKPRPPRRPPPDAPGGEDRYEALLAVLEQQAEQKREAREREAREVRGRSHRGRVPGWLLPVLLVLAVWVWVFPPSFLTPPDPVRPSLAQEEEALRFAVYVQAQRVQAFEVERGRLPETLGEVGPPIESVEYVRLGPDLYQLTGATDRLALTYRSDLPLAEFLGSGGGVLDAPSPE